MIRRLCSHPLVWLFSILHLAVVGLSSIGYAELREQVAVVESTYVKFLHLRLWFFLFAAHTWVFAFMVIWISEDTIRALQAKQIS